MCPSNSNPESEHTNFDRRARGRFAITALRSPAWQQVDFSFSSMLRRQQATPGNRKKAGMPRAPAPDINQRDKPSFA